MPTFLCEECGCVDSTALGHYWGRHFLKFKDATKNGKALCSECAPSEFDDGSIHEGWGKWHDYFEKRKPTATDELINRYFFN